MNVLIVPFLHWITNLMFQSLTWGESWIRSGFCFYAVRFVPYLYIGILYSWSMCILNVWLCQQTITNHDYKRKGFYMGGLVVHQSKSKFVSEVKKELKWHWTQCQWAVSENCSSCLNHQHFARWHENASRFEWILLVNIHIIEINHSVFCCNLIKWCDIFLL